MIYSNCRHECSLREHAIRALCMPSTTLRFIIAFMGYHKRTNVTVNGLAWGVERRTYGVPTVGSPSQTIKIYHVQNHRYVFCYPFRWCSQW
jgi:hypothetical protein